MNRYSFGLKFVSGTVLVFAVLAAVALWLKGPGAPRVMEPKDQELISTFHAHRQAFEQLQEMVTQDARRGWYLEGSDSVQTRPASAGRVQQPDIPNSSRASSGNDRTHRHSEVHLCRRGHSNRTGLGRKGLSTCRATRGRASSCPIWTRQPACQPMFTYERSSQGGSSSISVMSDREARRSPQRRF